MSDVKVCASYHDFDEHGISVDRLFPPDAVWDRSKSNDRKNSAKKSKIICRTPPANQLASSLRAARC